MNWYAPLAFILPNSSTLFLIRMAALGSQIRCSLHLFTKFEKVSGATGGDRKLWLGFQRRRLAGHGIRDTSVTRHSYRSIRSLLSVSEVDSTICQKSSAQLATENIGASGSLPLAPTKLWHDSRNGPLSPSKASTRCEMVSPLHKFAQDFITRRFGTAEITSCASAVPFCSAIPTCGSPIESRGSPALGTSGLGFQL